MEEIIRTYVLGSGALDDKPPLLETVNDESDCGIGICSVVDGEEAATFVLRVFLKNYYNKKQIFISSTDQIGNSLHLFFPGKLKGIEKILTSFRFFVIEVKLYVYVLYQIENKQFG